MADDQPPKAPRSLREELKKTLDESEWSWLAPHLVRDAVILVSHDLDLLTVGETVSRDEKGQDSGMDRSGLHHQTHPRADRGLDEDSDEEIPDSHRAALRLGSRAFASLRF